SYPEAHMVAMLAYAVSNNRENLDQQIGFIATNYPNWMIPLYWSSDLLIRNKHFTTLTKILQPIVEVANPDKILQNLYVAALLNLQQIQPAKAYLTVQLTTGNNHNNVLINLSLVELQLVAYPEALTYLNQVQLNDTSLANVITLLKGVIYDYTGQNSNAIAQYQLVNNGPLLAISNIMLLTAYLNNGNYAAVNTMLDKLAHDEKLNDEQTVLFKSGYYLGEGKYKWGYELLKSKLALYGKHPDYLYQYAAFSGMMNYTQQSIDLYKKYLKYNPTGASGYNDLAYIYTEQTSNYKLAQKYAAKAYQLAPTNPNVLDTLGWVYYKLGDYNKALPYIKTSYEMNYSPESAKHLSAVYAALNRQDLAKNVKIIDKSQLQQQLKQQVIYKLQVLLSYLQFGIEVK
ncbi:MAG: tetratricopeptide repeat protein, partial [Burkholderiales bacterium]|nr:tetratricopeptide repeat protein [Burkholderiales bacterium]